MIQYQCPVPGCTNLREAYAVACPSCWKKVPHDVRRTFRGHPNGEAQRAIIKWFNTKGEYG